MSAEDWLLGIDTSTSKGWRRPISGGSAGPFRRDVRPGAEKARRGRRTLPPGRFNPKRFPVGRYPRPDVSPPVFEGLEHPHLPATHVHRIPCILLVPIYRYMKRGQTSRKEYVQGGTSYTEGDDHGSCTLSSRDAAALRAIDLAQ